MTPSSTYSLNPWAITSLPWLWCPDSLSPSPWRKAITARRSGLDPSQLNPADRPWRKQPSSALPLQAACEATKPSDVDTAHLPSPPVPEGLAQTGRIQAQAWSLQGSRRGQVMHFRFWSLGGLLKIYDSRYRESSRHRRDVQKALLAGDKGMEVCSEKEIHGSKLSFLGQAEQGGCPGSALTCPFRVPKHHTL